MSRLKMPDLKAHENGELEIISNQANGWVKCYPPTERMNGVTVFHHPETEAELVIMCARLEEGEAVHVSLVPPLETMIHHEWYLEPDQTGNDETEAMLAYAVKHALMSMERAYNDRPSEHNANYEH